MTEYGLIVAVISVVAVLAMFVIGSNVGNVINDVTATLHP